jgi:hypothetical protein
VIDAYRHTYTYIFISQRSISKGYRKSMASSQEGQIIICGECGSQMGAGVIQPDGTIKFVCTRDFRHILFVTQNN